MSYRQGLDMYEKTAQILQDKLDAGVIDKFTSEWAGPVVLVPKHDIKMWFCADYRKKNLVTVADTYPLPRMFDLIDSMGDENVL